MNSKLLPKKHNNHNPLVNILVNIEGIHVEPQLNSIILILFGMTFSYNWRNKKFDFSRLT